MNADLKTALRNRALQELEQLTAKGAKDALSGDMEAARRSTATLSGWHGCSLWLADDDDFAATASRGRMWVCAAIAHHVGNRYVLSDMDKRLAWRDAA